MIAPFSFFIKQRTFYLGVEYHMHCHVIASVELIDIVLHNSIDMIMHILHGIAKNRVVH